MNGDGIRLEPGWKARVGERLREPPMQELADFLRRQKQEGRVIHPAGSRIFAALDATPFDTVKVVLFGKGAA